MKKNSSAWTILFSVIFFLCSCSDTSKKNGEVFNLLNEGLENSTNTVNVSSAQILQSIQDKLSDPTWAERAMIWLPYAKLITDHTADLFTYIKALKSKEDITKQKATELFNKMIQYERNVLDIDSSIRYTFLNHFTLFSRSFDSITNKPDNFYTTFFKGISHEAYLGVLNRFQNNIKVIENKVLLLCHEKTSPMIHICEFPSAIVVADKKLFKTWRID